MAGDDGASEPDDVAAQVHGAGRALAARFGSVTDGERPGRRSDGAPSTIASFARSLLHDVEHHLRDVRR